MSKEKAYLPYVALVAVVAVVAVVVLVLNVRTPSSEEAVAGEATFFKPAFSSEKLEFVSGQQVYAYYGPRPVQKSGMEVCKDLGYKRCVAAIHTIIDRYYTSTNGTCVGSQRDENRQSITSCDTVPSEDSCLRYASESTEANLEPWTGDLSILRELSGAFCIR